MLLFIHLFRVLLDLNIGSLLDIVELILQFKDFKVYFFDFLTLKFLGFNKCFMFIFLNLKKVWLNLCLLKCSLSLPFHHIFHHFNRIGLLISW